MKEEKKVKAREVKAVKKEAVKVWTARKKLEEMNLLDDFLFGSVVTYPEIGERFVALFLKTMFGREFKHLSVTAQKVYYGADSEFHGARLDVYMEPEIEDSEERAAVYDLEPDQNGSEAAKKSLPRRMRFYHGKIAAKELEAGADYDKLKDVVIIMIMSYDPFGLDYMVYTVKNTCVDVPELLYEDGASTIFLYTKGAKGMSDEKLKQMLHYMEDSTDENAVNDDLKEIHRMVKTVKRDPGVSIGYLRLMEKLNRSKAEGALYSKIVQVCKKMKKNKTLEQIAEELEEDVTVIKPIYHTAKEFAPEYDPELVFEEINGEE